MRWQFDQTCPLCRSDVTAETVAPEDGNRLAVITRCTRCDSRMMITVALTVIDAADLRRAHRRSQPIECGTDRGYYAHRRAKETPCQPCKAAHAAQERDRIAARIELG